MKSGKRFAVLPALILCLVCVMSAANLTVYAADAAQAQESVQVFRYRHDPRLNPKAMADIVVDETAVYGFAPSPDGSLKQYAVFDWTDPDFVKGEDGRLARIAYHESINEMYAMLGTMKSEGKSIEEIARAVSAKRNEIRMASYEGKPDELAVMKARNLEKYGHEDGPHAEELYEQYGSWETVLEKAFSVNSGMDACLGLYDDYYELYVMSGEIEEEHTASATREYAVTAFTEAAGLSLPDTADALNGFSDAQEVSPHFAEGLADAVSAGILRGYEDHTLRAKNTISRAEALVLLSRCLPELEQTAGAASFADVPAWAKSDVDRLSSAGLVVGIGDDMLGADDDLTVEQVGLLTSRLRDALAAKISR